MDAPVRCHGKHGPIALRAVTDGPIGRIGIAVPYMIGGGAGEAGTGRHQSPRSRPDPDPSRVRAYAMPALSSSPAP